MEPQEPELKKPFVIKVHDPKKGKKVRCGVYNPMTKTFTAIKQAKHFMFSKLGYGMQFECYTTLKELGCETVKIIKKFGDMRTLYSDLQRWEWGEPEDKSHGKQLFLKEQIMRLTKDEPQIRTTDKPFQQPTLKDDFFPDARDVNL